MTTKKLPLIIKPFVLLLIWHSVVFATGQDKFFTRSGYIKFFSSTPVEDILAENHKVSSVLDASTGQIEFAVLIKAFEFGKALMEEHFNENYMESDKFPKATFKGKISGLAMDAAKISKKQAVQATGDLTIHGVTKQVSIPGYITVDNESVLLESEFTVAPSDYDIRIPNTVKNNIAKEITVTVKMQLNKL